MKQRSCRIFIKKDHSTLSMKTSMSVFKNRIKGAQKRCYHSNIWVLYVEKDTSWEQDSSHARGEKRLDLGYSMKGKVTRCVDGMGMEYEVI